MKQIIEKVFTNSVILSGAKNLNLPLTLALSRKGRGKIISSATPTQESTKSMPMSTGRATCVAPLSRICKFAFRSLTNSTLSQRDRVCAFTLAEVLITLGIIGVIAALTLPTLIQNYQKQVWVNQLKKAVSVWENGMKMMLADAETDDLRNTEFWQSLPIYEHYGCYYVDDYSISDNILKKYFKILKFANINFGNDYGCALGALDDGTEYKALNGDSYGIFDTDTRKIYMADGTLYGLGAYNPDHDNDDIAGLLAIDVNGENKGPNQWGRDTFIFDILENGNLRPYNSYEDFKSSSYVCGNLETGDISNANGYGCAARIIADGWKMNC